MDDWWDDLDLTQDFDTPLSPCTSQGKISWSITAEDLRIVQEAGLGRGDADLPGIARILRERRFLLGEVARLQRELADERGTARGVSLEDLRPFEPGDY